MVHSRGTSMNAKRPVLVTTDGSSHSHRVLPHAALLAGALDTRGTLLHVLEESGARGGAGGGVGGPRGRRGPEHEPGGKDDAAAMEACRQELTRARGLLPLDASVETVIGEIPRGAGVDTAIIEKALELNAHAIALSTHGQSAMRHVVMGSMATTMLGRSPLPLILARSDV